MFKRLLLILINEIKIIMVHSILLIHKHSPNFEMSNQTYTEEEIKEYLNKNVMPSLLPAVEALLKEVGLYFFYMC